MKDINEDFIWAGTSSQMMNAPYVLIWTFVAALCLQYVNEAGAILIIPAAFAIFKILWRVLSTATRKYTITRRRIKVSEGLLKRNTYDIEVSRIRDVLLTEPVLLRLFKLGHIRVLSWQATSEYIELRGIKAPHDIREILSELASTHYYN